MSDLDTSAVVGRRVLGLGRQRCTSPDKAPERSRCRAQRACSFSSLVISAKPVMRSGPVWRKILEMSAPNSKAPEEGFAERLPADSFGFRHNLRDRSRTPACNYYLRRTGINPGPARPECICADAAMAAAIRVAFPARRRLLRLSVDGRRGHPVMSTFIEQPAKAGALLADPKACSPRNYNRKQFSFAHGLAGHPLLRARQSGRAVAADAGPSRYLLVERQGEGRQRVGTQAPLFGRPCRTPSPISRPTIPWVILKHTEQDPGARAGVAEFLFGQVVQLAGERMRCDVTIGETLILISSPNRLTPYHMDAETNFLVQVRGDKMVPRV